MSHIDRRAFVVSLAGAGLSAATGGATAQAPAAGPGANPPRFGFDDVVRRARDLSSAPLAAPAGIPEALARLDANAAREIRFKPERALFGNGGSLFRLQTIHLDTQSPRAVTVNTIRDGIATPIPYAASLFDYGRVKLDKALPVNLGFAGFRLQFPLNDPRGFDDAIVFSGSSQFRVLGRGQRPGAALRGLTVNAGLDNEEFPFFREFWIETPEPNAERATIYALLDGDSITGAFRFDIAPGQDTAVEVTASLFPRRIGGVLGFAPIATMFLSNENERRAGSDFRPEIHDSDGLALRTGAEEWLWRPLRNPAKGDRFQFLDRDIKGFGLIQRDRTFDHFQDLEQAYELRPSYWIEPMADWGEGRVELVEKPATDASAQNVSAAWVSAEAREPGKPINLAYRVTACLESRRISPLGRAVNTFQTSAAAPGDAAPGGTRRFLIDFSGGELAYFLGDASAIEILATAANGRVIKASLAPNPHVKGFRASVDVEAAPGQTADIRVALRAGGRALTETWTLPWTG